MVTVIGNPVHFIVNLLKSRMFNLQVEKDAQRQIEAVLISGKIDYEREPHLSSKDIPDFRVLDGIFIEVKIKGNAKAIFDQCERYSKHEKVQTIILMTNRAMGFPEQINGKPCYFINMGEAWL